MFWSVVRTYLLKLNKKNKDLYDSLLEKKEHKCYNFECFTRLNPIYGANVEFEFFSKNQKLFYKEIEIDFECFYNISCIHIKKYNLFKMSCNYFLVLYCSGVTCEFQKIALDLNQRTFIITSNNDKYDLMKTKKYIEKLNDLNVSNTSKKQKLKQKIINNLHQEINQIVNELIYKYDIFYLEDLGLTKKEKFNYRINNYVFSFFRSVLVSKCHLLNKKVVFIPKNYPSTKICSTCLKINQIELNVSKYECKYCNLIINRDYNSALNILNCGIQIYS